MSQVHLCKLKINYTMKFGAASEIIDYTLDQFCGTFDVSKLIWLYLVLYLTDYTAWQSSIHLLYLCSPPSKTVNLLSKGLLSRCVLFDVANITTLAFTFCVFLTLVLETLLVPS